MRIIILLSILYFFSCNSKISHFYFDPNIQNENVTSLESLDKSKKICKDPLNYAPAEDYNKYFKKRTIRMNFHFPDDSTRSNNFQVGEGNEFFTNMVNNCNYRFGINKKMNLPEGNDTPVLNPQFQFKITPSKDHLEAGGFYYETDNELSYFVNKGRDRNNYNRSIIKKYAIDDDTILNAFIMPHNPDSLRSKTYKTYGSGIALGSSVKVAGIYQLGGADWAYATLLNHEVGHVFGLSHSWGTDGCDDTPRHPNCYSKTGNPPCNGAVSNNVMDYNNSQMSWTPCQLGRVHMKIADTTAFQRKLVIPTWCQLDSSKDIVIDSKISWLGGRDVSHNIIIKEGGHLTLCCRLSMPKNSKIIVNPGGKLTLNDIVLHNDCGDQWLGIQVISNGKHKGLIEKIGKVELYDTLTTNL